MDETQSLTNSGLQRKDSRYFIFVILNVLVVIFSLLAFVFAVLSFSNDVHFSTILNNSTSYQNSGNLEQKATVAYDMTVYGGTVTSYCSHTGDVCEGLGPAWYRPFFEDGTNSGAIYGDLTQLSPSLAIYPHVVDKDHSFLRVTVINTGQTPSFGRTMGVVLPVNVTSTDIRSVKTGDPNAAVLLITTHNTTHNTTSLVVATVHPIDYSVDLSPALEIIDTPGNDSTRELRIDIANIGDWILVSYGYDNEAITHKVFTLDNNSPTKLSAIQLSGGDFSLLVYRTIATAYWGSGKIIQSNGNTYVFGQIDYANRRINQLASMPLEHEFDKLIITPIYYGLVVFSGIQTSFVDVPLTLAFVVNVTNSLPFLYNLGRPSYIFNTNNYVPLRNHMSVLYIPPSPQEPFGGLFYSFVDTRSRMAKLVKSRPVHVGYTSTDDNVRIVSSPPISISDYQYGRMLFPLLAGPTLNNLTLIVIQDQVSVANVFYWYGGYQYAGIAQRNAGSLGGVTIVREGVSSSHSGLIPGHLYYAGNRGELMPYMSVNEQFTPNAVDYPIGVALSDTELLINPRAFELD